MLKANIVRVCCDLAAATSYLQRFGQSLNDDAITCSTEELADLWIQKSTDPVWQRFFDSFGLAEEVPMQVYNEVMRSDQSDRPENPRGWVIGFC